MEAVYQRAERPRQDACLPACTCHHQQNHLRVESLSALHKMAAHILEYILALPYFSELHLGTNHKTLS